MSGLAKGRMEIPRSGGELAPDGYIGRITEEDIDYIIGPERTGRKRSRAHAAAFFGRLEERLGLRPGAALQLYCCGRYEFRFRRNRNGDYYNVVLVPRSDPLHRLLRRLLLLVLGRR